MLSRPIYLRKGRVPHLSSSPSCELRSPRSRMCDFSERPEHPREETSPVQSCALLNKFSPRQRQVRWRQHRRLFMSKFAMSALSLPGRAAAFARVERDSCALRDKQTLPISVVIAVKNEAGNLPLCLESLRNFGEVVVVDSQSSDNTAEIARSSGADVVQFYYRGGWPKKRQWALENLPLRYDWVLLLDADESVTPELFAEIAEAIRIPELAGCYIGLEMFFLGRRLQHCGATFYKLSLFRRGMAGFECRTPDQDASMCDMEVHEHLVAEGPKRRLKSKLLHRNVDSLSRYIRKHDEYSNWEAQVWSQRAERNALPPNLLASQAQRRRWFKKHFLPLPGSPVLLFVYRYFVRLGFLDGVPGLLYCAFQAIQLFHVKAKLYEKRVAGQAHAMKPAGIGGESHVRH
jgi:glycosyltransferase involved in cell wall biosynthesis